MHLEIQLQRDKGSVLLVLQGINVGCCHVNEIPNEQENTIVFQSKHNGVCLASGMRHSANFDESSQQTILVSFLKFFSSAGVRAMTVDAVPVPLIVLELNCDKC